MKYAACVVIYNLPKEEIARVKLYAKSFYVVYILDNSNIFDLLSWEDCTNIIYHWNGGNIGLPASFNWVLNKVQGSIDYLCLIDQDSVFTSDNIELLKTHIESNREYITRRVGIVAPYINYDNSSFRREEKEICVPWVITSGSFVNVKLICQNHLRYDEDYFIDRCEVDFCRQLVLKNYKIMLYMGAVLNQKLGDDNGSKHTSHNPIRHYYIFRNRFYYNKKFYSPFKRIFLNVAQTIKHLGHVLWFESDKVTKIKMLTIAYMDYKRGRMGKKTF